MRGARRIRSFVTKSRAHVKCALNDALIFTSGDEYLILMDRVYSL